MKYCNRQKILNHFRKNPQNQTRNVFLTKSRVRALDKGLFKRNKVLFGKKRAKRVVDKFVKAKMKVRSDHKVHFSAEYFMGLMPLWKKALCPFVHTIDQLFALDTSEITCKHCLKILRRIKA
jgi:hypothetical protein